MFASSYPLLDIFWSIVEVFLFVIYLWLLIVIFSDIFRSHDLGGVAKTLWVLFVLIVPLLGILVYLIARGGTMQERAIARAEDQRRAFDAYVRESASGSGRSTADELSRLADLKASGVITDAEFESEKAKILA